MKRLIFIAVIIAIAHGARVRIIEGTIAAAHEFQYQVSIQWNYANGSRPAHFCSGSILNRRWILTAAHCDGNYTPEGWIEIVAGVNNIATEETGAQRRNVSRFVAHERYSSATLRNDIAVIRLSKPLHFGTTIGTIRLANNDTVIDHTAVAKFAGWGSISKTWDDIFPDELRRVDLPLRTMNDCEKMRPSVDNSVICAGGYRNVSGCTADSGGPLTITVGDRAAQIGLLSYGEKPCRATMPVVFTSVPHFYAWIQSKIAK
ncbi:chymotrypsin-like protease CTRL-1 [Anopheles bellator]|uniref:chymotrypsin-like protease CTRL-1 n=1 Tax=Anopheles bellator TaxID=139047 RepID=UPI0026497294|nr:chymotrypsin-like protease CTRL-1 [Anopheles bellator]